MTWPSPPLEAAQEVLAAPSCPRWTRFAPWLAAAYLAGVVLMLLRLVDGLWRSRRLAMTGEPVRAPRLVRVLDQISRQWSLRAAPVLRQAEEVVVPKVVGLVRPTILLPAAALTGLTPGELDMILAHELAYVRRHDMWVHLAQRLAEAVLFFNPALWWLSRRVSTLREYCCDELACEAVQPHDGEPRLRYAQALLHVVELKGSAHQTGQLAALAATGRSPSELRRRVARLFGEPIREPLRLSRGGVLVLAAALLVLFASPAVWTSKAATDPPDKADEPIEKAVDDNTPAQLFGRIVLEDGSPATTKGWLYSESTREKNPNSAYIAKSNEGQFTDSFECKVAPGTVWLTYFPQGFAPAWLGPLEMKPGEARDNLRLVLNPGFSELVRLSDEEGQPVAGATVIAHPEINGQCEGPVITQATDANGELKLEHLANTRYALTITASGYQPLRTAPLRMEAGEVLRPTMSRSQLTTGVVRYADGTPAKSATLRCKYEERASGRSESYTGDGAGSGFWGERFFITDQQGRFELDGLTTGSQYLFIVEAIGPVRAIVHNLEAGQKDVQIALPNRRDLIVKVTGDLSKFPERRGKAYVSIRQPIPFFSKFGTQNDLLAGDDAFIEPTEKGGVANFRGLAVDLNPDAGKQQVRVSLGDMEKTVELNPNGDTVVEFVLPGATKLPQAEKATSDALPLRCRLVAVSPGSDDESPDLTKTANEFSNGDDLTFAVELTNVSDEPVTLLGTRLGESYGKAKGKLNTKFFGPHLFDFEFTDAQGDRVHRAERAFVSDLLALHGASAHTLAPGESLNVLLRPADFMSPMDHRLPSGQFRARVRYLGPSGPAIAAMQEHWPDSPEAKAWSGEAVSNPVDFTIVADSPAPKPNQLNWGPEKDGLQAAIEYWVPKGVAGDPAEAPGVPVRTKLDVVFHVKNVGKRPKTFVSETGRQGDTLKVTDASGSDVPVKGAWYSGWPINVRWNLQAGEVAELKVLAPAIDTIQDPGKYNVRYTIRFNSQQSRDKEGKVIFPLPGDWQDELETGDAPLYLRADEPAVPSNPRFSVRPARLLNSAEEIEAAQADPRASVLNWSPYPGKTEVLTWPAGEPPLVTEQDVLSAETTPIQGRPDSFGVDVKLTPEGGERMWRETTRLLLDVKPDQQPRMLFEVDGKVVATPRLMSPLRNAFQISGSPEKQEEVEALARAIKPLSKPKQ